MKQPHVELPVIKTALTAVLATELEKTEAAKKTIVEAKKKKKEDKKEEKKTAPVKKTPVEEKKKAETKTSKPHNITPLTLFS